MLYGLSCRDGGRLCIRNLFILFANPLHHRRRNIEIRAGRVDRGPNAWRNRAREPAGLAAVQAAAWDPIVVWAGEALGARLELAEGVRFVAQPAAALAAIRAEIGKFAPPFALAALASATTLTGSALLALALARRRLTVEEAWAAAHVDEDWNIRQWGEDADAARRRAARYDEFAAAARMIAALA